MEVAPTNSKKRILYVITKANWGGAQRYVYDMALGAKAQGYSVLVVSGSEGELTARLRDADIRTESIQNMQRDIKLVGEWRSYLELLAHIRTFNPDIVHGNSSKAGALAALAARVAGVPTIVFTAHGWAFNENRPAWQRGIIALLHFFTVLLSHTTICVSDAVHRQAAWMPLVQRKLQTVHIGIDTLTFKTREEARRLLAPDLHKQFPQALWVGTIAELHPTKGLDVLIKSFSAAPREAVLVLIGDGQEWNHLQKLIQIGDASDRIVLAGFVKDAAQYLPAFDVFVLPSRSEALGYALLEAGAASLPSIGSRVGGIPEVLKDKESGILVPPGETAPLEDALTLLCENEILRETLGKALHERVTRVFTKDKMLRETFALYSR
ncbi:glycosyltransferase [Patescibacteria group bacterium]|nr:glycosyltransferase [Patescibacteria group bacterium]MBU1500707.1 glycosyltransferase [Patescibacteria group bacterium]MBU2080975.1 glycosyltransferase [Patescibacteria group bacterium]MBU2124243.1 glycosyltransferase [Patescibacteria group bacterium]MBU2195036.1 glycosyltransferase [Patescibacteria group bacterium]